MNFEFKNKKNLIFIIIFILILLIGGFFWWKEKKEENLGKLISRNIFVKGEDYKVIESPEGKFVKNEKEGLIVMVSEDWIVKKYEEEVDFLSPEVEFDEYGAPSLKSVREKGACGMVIEIYNSIRINPEISTFADDLINEINYLKENPNKSQKEENPKNEVILVDNKLAIKRIYNKEEQIRAIEVEVPVGQTVYRFESGLIINQNCINEFNKILETVSINK